MCVCVCVCPCACMSFSILNGTGVSLVWCRPSTCKVSPSWVYVSRVLFFSPLKMNGSPTYSPIHSTDGESNITASAPFLLLGALVRRYVELSFFFTYFVASVLCYCTWPVWYLCSLLAGCILVMEVMFFLAFYLTLRQGLTTYWLTDPWPAASCTLCYSFMKWVHLW